MSYERAADCITESDRMQDCEPGNDCRRTKRRLSKMDTVGLQKSIKECVIGFAGGQMELRRA